MRSMSNNNVKKMLLFVTLCVILAGIVFATDGDFDSSNVEDTICYQTTDTPNEVSEVKENAITDDNKKIDNIETEKNIKTATNKIKTKASIDYVSNVPVDNWILISGTLKDVNNNPLRDTSVKLDVNGDSYPTETDYYGDFFGEYHTTMPGTNTITVSYAGNSKYEPTTAKRTFNVTGQAKTYIELNSLKETTVGNTVSISGYYYYGNDNPLTSTTMRLNINGQSFTAKTNNNGFFTYNYKTTKTGTNTVTVSYPGNAKFKAATATKTFNVKSIGPQYTYITLNNIADVAFGGYTTISGHYYYGNNIPLTYTNMRLNINGKQVTAKTDKTGYFTYNYKTDRVGKNTVTVTYPGNANFQKATETKTFNVKITSPIPTYITLTNIKEVNNGQTTTISGHYYYSNNIPLTQTTMRLNINGQTYTTKTDNNGYFTYNYRTSNDGSNTVTVSYPGNANFKKASATKTFNVKSVGPQYTYITLNNIPQVAYDEYLTISGHYYYGNNIPLTYTPMTININGYKYTAKTDNTGYFSLGYWTEKVGSNTVTVSYHGNNNFKAASATKTFNVIITSPIPTYITLNNIKEVTQGQTTTISGHYYYSNNIPLTQTTMRLNINGQTYTTKTDNNGYFTYNYKTSKVGTNTVTVTYPGNSNFQYASNSKTFTVSQPVYQLELKIGHINDYTPGSSKYLNNHDPVYAFYETSNYAQYPRGVYVELDSRGLSTAPYNKFIKATFYFRNNYDSSTYTKTVTKTEWDRTLIETDMISGYTPYKVLLYYSPRTDDERRNFQW